MPTSPTTETSCPQCGIPFTSANTTPGCEGCDEAFSEGLKQHPHDCDCDPCIQYQSEKRSEFTP